MAEWNLIPKEQGQQGNMTHFQPTVSEQMPSCLQGKVCPRLLDTKQRAHPTWGGFMCTPAYGGPVLLPMLDGSGGPVSGAEADTTPQPAGTVL